MDGFQGREKDLVFFSCVRTGNVEEPSNHTKNSNNNSNASSSFSTGIGFLSDERRLNVAITRARVQLVLVGSCEILRSCSVWRQLLRSLDDRKAVKLVDFERFRRLNSQNGVDSSELVLRIL